MFEEITDTSKKLYACYILLNFLVDAPDVLNCAILRLHLTA